MKKNTAHPNCITEASFKKNTVTIRPPSQSMTSSLSSSPSVARTDTESGAVTQQAKSDTNTNASRRSPKKAFAKNSPSAPAEKTSSSGFSSSGLHQTNLLPTKHSSNLELSSAFPKSHVSSSEMIPATGNTENVMVSEITSDASSHSPPPLLLKSQERNTSCTDLSPTGGTRRTASRVTNRPAPTRKAKNAKEGETQLQSESRGDGGPSFTSPTQSGDTSGADRSSTRGTQRAVSRLTNRPAPARKAKNVKKGETQPQSEPQADGGSSFTPPTQSGDTSGADLSSTGGTQRAVSRVTNRPAPTRKAKNAKEGETQLQSESRGDGGPSFTSPTQSGDTSGADRSSTRGTQRAVSRLTNRPAPARKAKNVKKGETQPQSEPQADGGSSFTPPTQSGDTSGADLSSTGGTQRAVSRVTNHPTSIRKSKDANRKQVPSPSFWSSSSKLSFLPPVTPEKQGQKSSDKTGDSLDLERTGNPTPALSKPSPRASSIQKQSMDLYHCAMDFFHQQDYVSARDALELLIGMPFLDPEIANRAKVFLKICSYRAGAAATPVPSRQP